MPDDDASLRKKPAPRHQKTVLWAGLAALGVLGVLLAVTASRHEAAARFGPPIAQLSGKAGISTVVVQMSSDGHSLALHATPPVGAGPNQSYQLWLIPDIGKPVSLAVMSQLDAVLAVSYEQRAGLRGGAALAISAEPAGGSTSGQPGGAVILAGSILE